MELALTAMLIRADNDRPLREVVFADYKATRRCDPRVTNRGVTPDPTEKEQI
jgi:hypothetical protein